MRQKTNCFRKKSQHIGSGLEEEKGIMAHVFCIVRTHDMGNGHLEGLFNVLQITHGNISLADWGGLTEALIRLNFLPSDISQGDVEADWQRWKDLLLGAATDHIPSIKVKPSTGLTTNYC